MKVFSMTRRQFNDMDKECFTIQYKTTWNLPQFGLHTLKETSNVRRESNVELRYQLKLVKEFLNYELMKTDCVNKLTSLVDRRLRGDLIETYKIVTGKEKVRKEDFFVFNFSLTRVIIYEDTVTSWLQHVHTQSSGGLSQLFQSTCGGSQESSASTHR